MNFIRNSCIRVPLVYQEEAWFKQLVEQLTRRGPSYDDPTVILTTKYYMVRDGNLLIPRFYPIEKLGHTTTTYLNEGEDIDIEFKASWKNEKQNNGYKMLMTNHHGVLRMLPGEGKTVVSIGAICSIKKKAIIFVHKEYLAEQWKERFLEHSTITEKQIGVLKTDKYDTILFSKPVVISTVQTMCSMINRIDNIEKILAEANFGISFWDECHTSVSAEQFSKSSLLLPCKRTFGLSATPSRTDGNDDIIQFHTGLVYDPKGKGNTMEPRIIMLYFDHRAVAQHQSYIYHPIKKGQRTGPFDKSRWLKMLTSKDDKRYIPYLKKISRQVYDAGRTTLFLADRIKILDEVSKEIPKHNVGFFIPRSGKQRNSDLLKQFVFSTYGSARDGVDRKEFDCLILATPVSNIEQAVGRIQRELPGKQQPIVFDIIDTGCTEIENRASKRKWFYEKKKWEIEEKHLK